MPDGKRNGRHCFTHYVGFLILMFVPQRWSHVWLRFNWEKKKKKSHIRVAAAFGCPADSRCRHLATQVSHLSSVLLMSHCNNAAGSSSSSRVQAVHVHQRGWPCCKCSLSALLEKKKTSTQGVLPCFSDLSILESQRFWNSALDGLFREQWGGGLLFDMFTFQ